MLYYIHCTNRSLGEISIDENQINFNTFVIGKCSNAAGFDELSMNVFQVHARAALSSRVWFVGSFYLMISKYIDIWRSNRRKNLLEIGEVHLEYPVDQQRYFHCSHQASTWAKQRYLSVLEYFNEIVILVYFQAIFSSNLSVFEPPSINNTPDFGRVILFGIVMHI